MKRILILGLVLVLLVSAFAACGGTADTETKAPETNAPITDTPETEGTTDGYDASFDRNSVADTVPTDLRFDGETVTFFIRNNNDLWTYEMDVDSIMNDTLYDSIYYRNKTVEERLGVTITTIGQPGGFGERFTWNDALRTAVNTKSGDFDSAAIYLSQGTPLALESMYYNVKELPYITLSQPWWNQKMQKELTLFNTLYYLAGDIAVSETSNIFAMFYNKNLFDQYYGSSDIDLYKVINDGQWTIDYMYDLVTPVYEDLDGSGGMSDGDLVGYISCDPDYNDSINDGWVAACGIDITTMVNGIPELSFYSERTVRAFESVYRLQVESAGTLSYRNPEKTTFADGKSMFVRNFLNGGETFREMKDAYGVLPLPMLEEDQEGGYSTTIGNTASLIVVLSSLPDERQEVVGATLELMAAESYKQVTPTYYEVALKTKYADSPEDAKIYDLILNSVDISFGYCYSTQNLNGIGALFRVMSADIAKSYDENDEVYEQKLQDLIDGLDNAAFNAAYGS